MFNQIFVIVLKLYSVNLHFTDSKKNKMGLDHKSEHFYSVLKYFSSSLATSCNLMSAQFLLIQFTYTEVQTPAVLWQIDQNQDRSLDSPATKRNLAQLGLRATVSCPVSPSHTKGSPRHQRRTSLKCTDFYVCEFTRRKKPSSFSLKFQIKELFHFGKCNDKSQITANDGMRSAIKWPKKRLSRGRRLEWNH